MATLPHPQPRTGGNSLNLAMAVLAAGSLAFLTYAMPDDIFSGLVEQSGLPAILAAAEPPLGMKARLAVVAAGALLAFAIILLLMRALDRVGAKPRGKPEPRAKAEAEEEAPRLRRADAHPDAPSRRPLLAGRDLGDFIEPDQFDDFDEMEEPERFADLPAQPLPGFLMPEQAEAEAAPAPSEPEPARPFLSDPEPAFQPELEHRPEHEPEPEVEPLELTQEANGFDELVSQLPEVGEVREGESIAALMRRLETGLSQREQVAGPEEEESEEEAAPHDIMAEAPEALPPAVETAEAFEPQPIAAEPEISFPHAVRSASAEDEPPLVERDISFLQPDEPEVAEAPAVEPEMPVLHAEEEQEPAATPDAAFPHANEAEIGEAPHAGKRKIIFPHADEPEAAEEPRAAEREIAFLHADEPEAAEAVPDEEEFAEAEEEPVETEEPDARAEIPFRHAREPEGGAAESREIPFHRMTELAARRPAREPDFPYSREPDLSSFPHMREPWPAKSIVPLNGAEPNEAAGEVAPAEPDIAPPAEAQSEEPASVVAEQPQAEFVPPPQPEAYEAAEVPEAHDAAEEREAFEPGPVAEEAAPEPEPENWDEPQSLYPPVPLPAPEPDYPPIEQQVGHRLRAAIGGLNRAAGRN